MLGPFLLALLLTGCRTDGGAPLAEHGGRPDRDTGRTTRGEAGPHFDEGHLPNVRLLLSPADLQMHAYDTSFVILTIDEIRPEIRYGSNGWSYPWDTRQAPFAVLADFDGDGRRDVALLQRSVREERAVVLLRSPGGHRLVELQRWPRALVDIGRTGSLTSYYLSLQPAGVLRVRDFAGDRGDTTVTMHHEGVRVVAVGQAARTYWYANRGVHFDNVGGLMRLGRASGFTRVGGADAQVDMPQGM